MKNTRIKALCFLLLLVFSVDAYSQLKAKSRTGNDGNGRCWQREDGSKNLGARFTLPTDNLIFDTSSPDADGCFPVINFGCDLHIGLTYEGDGRVTYRKITSCIIDQINIADNDQDEPPLTEYPGIVILISSADIAAQCEGGELLEFSLDLYCKDENGDFTPISDLAVLDTENNWATVFSAGNDHKTVIGEESWTTSIICCENIDVSVSGLPPLLTDVVPLIEQDDTGSRLFLKNFTDINNALISIFDANYQGINLPGNINMTSDNESTLDISNLNGGIYYIRIVDNGTVSSKTIIKM